MQVFLWPAHHFLQEFFSSLQVYKIKVYWMEKKIQSRAIAGIRTWIKNENMEKLSS